MQLKLKGILSYPNLFQPRSVNPGDDPKYGLSLLIKKGDPQIAKIEAAINAEKQNGFPNGFPATGKSFLKDGDVGGVQPGYMIVSAGSKADQKPAVVDAGLQPVIDPALVYAGAVAWVSINTFSYNKPVNKGVSAGLNGVMITGEEGELGRLDGRPTVENMFGDVAAATPSFS